jgi:hypothetical protein
MPNPIVGLIGASAGSSVIGAVAQSKAADKAAAAQRDAADQSVAEQRRQFDAIKELMAPFVSGGTDAFSQMADLAGVSGPEAQAAQIAAIEQSPELAAKIAAGEEALLANASATGGLRGGNTQAALAELRPNILADQIGTQFSRLGGLANIGQSSAAMQASAGQNFANTATSAYGQMGAATAGAALARGTAVQNAASGITKGFGTALGLGGFEAPEGAKFFGSWSGF